MKPLTRAERLALIGKPLSYPEHNFRLSRPDWERAVFDNAEYFMTLDLRRPADHQRWPTFPEALAFARHNEGVCIYAVTASERSTILERKAWRDWEERWFQRG